MKTLANIIHLTCWGLFIWGGTSFTLSSKPWEIGWGAAYFVVMGLGCFIFALIMGSLAPTLKKLEKGN